MQDKELRKYLGYPHVHINEYGSVSTVNTFELISNLSDEIRQLKRDFEVAQKEIIQLKCKHKEYTFITDRVNNDIIYIKKCRTCELNLIVYGDINVFLCEKAKYEKEKAICVIEKCDNEIKKNCCNRKEKTCKH